MTSIDKGGLELLAQRAANAGKWRPAAGDYKGTQPRFGLNPSDQKL